ncbi:hypothetical protein [Propionivibrio sp.]|uniref:hypothetical protein n=1 Tax=Propionivibrio sp. TaxID=2212460 RepID=UPI0039E5E43D
MAKFPFSDLHSFKDYVGFVGMCAPDQFPAREGVDPEYQWSLDLAFKGLYEGLSYINRKKVVYEACTVLFNEAYELYKNGDSQGGYFKVNEVQKLIKKIPSQ